jgi:hypothetical protein
VRHPKLGDRTVTDYAHDNHPLRHYDKASAACEIERLNKCIRWEQNRTGRIGTHAADCHLWGHQHYECLLREYFYIAAERDKLLANSDFDSKEYKRVRNELMNDIRRLANIVMDEYPESDDRYQIAADVMEKMR